MYIFKNIEQVQKKYREQFCPRDFIVLYLGKQFFGNTFRSTIKGMYNNRMYKDLQDDWLGSGFEPKVMLEDGNYRTYSATPEGANICENMGDEANGRSVWRNMGTEFLKYSLQNNLNGE